MKLVYLIIGSNIGDRLKLIMKAESNLKKKVGPIVKESSIYKSEAWGNNLLPEFLNKVIIIKTKISVESILSIISEIEKKLGRIRNGDQYISRTIDIDILFYDNLILKSKNLTIPHPKIEERRFVLTPLAQIVPEFIHPVSGQKISKLLEKCNDKLYVENID